MKPIPLKRIEEFEKKAFGMFIHYGLYSQLGKGEWVKKLRNISDEEYEKYFESFTAENFDAEKIVLMAKNAGMKYVTLTTRHHDGFSLYDTKGLNTYDAVHAPKCGRDLIAEFCEACKKHGIMPMFYHTTIDWHEKSYREDFNAYLEYLRKSIEILCTSYRKIGGFWFDGNWEKPDADWKENELYGTIRKYQPDAMIINNTGLNALGAFGHEELDSVTFERGKPQLINMDGSPKYLASEMCQITNMHWGYAERDFHFKSTKDLLEDLCLCRRYGANFLLNVGPRGDGKISEMDEALLGIIGKWVKIYGEAIYEARPCEAETVGKDFVLKGKDGKYYLFVHDLALCGDSNVVKEESSAKKVVITGIQEDIKNICWLDSGEELTYHSENNSVTVFAPPFFYGEDTVIRVAKIEV